MGQIVHTTLHMGYRNILNLLTSTETFEKNSLCLLFSNSAGWLTGWLVILNGKAFNRKDVSKNIFNFTWYRVSCPEVKRQGR
jgi:hypothetical protein